MAKTHLSTTLKASCANRRGVALHKHVVANECRLLPCLELPQTGSPTALTAAARVQMGSLGNATHKAGAGKAWQCRVEFRLMTSATDTLVLCVGVVGPPHNVRLVLPTCLHTAEVMSAG